MIKVRLHKHNNWLKDAGYSFKEEQEIYEQQLQDILDNTRWYLDNEQYLPAFRVSWVNYKLVDMTMPYKYTVATKRRRVK